MIGATMCAMSSSVSAMGVRFDEDNMCVDLSDGRTLGVPLAWFPNQFPRLALGVS